MMRETTPVVPVIQRERILIPQGYSMCNVSVVNSFLSHAMESYIMELLCCSIKKWSVLGVRLSSYEYMREVGKA